LKCYECKAKLIPSAHGGIRNNILATEATFGFISMAIHVHFKYKPLENILNRMNSVSIKKSFLTFM